MASQIYYQEQASTHPCPLSTHPVQFSHGVGDVGRRRGGISSSPKVRLREFILKGQIRAIAAKKFEEKETFAEGITFRDLCHGKYNIVETEQQAKNLLQYHKKNGFLFTKKPMSIPQEYFATQDQADTAAKLQEYKARTIPIDPTGVGDVQPHLSKKSRTKAVAKRYNLSRTISNQTSSPSYSYDTIKEIDQRKAENFYQVLEFYSKLIVDSSKKNGNVANDTGGIRVGAHKIQIHLQVYEGRAQEAYEEYLHDVAPNRRNNKAKELEAAVEISGNIYHVKACVFPCGTIDVYVPCPDNPFPLGFQDREKTNKDFLLLLAQIRCMLQIKMRDPHNRIIPPTHNPCWRLKNCDINFDVPTGAINLEVFPNLQAKQFYLLAGFRIYPRMVGAQPVIRVEKACKNFDMPLTDDIGLTLIEEALSERKALFSSMMNNSNKEGG